MSQTLFMETTQISPDRTVSEIESVLIEHGATAILKEANAGSITAVSFRFKTPMGDLPFCLPCRWEAVETLLAKRGGNRWLRDSQKFERREKAKRIAWRQILRWVEAQMALVETTMVRVEEVFFPYLQDHKTGRTIFEIQAEKNFGLLEHKP